MCNAPIARQRTNVEFHRMSWPKRKQAVLPEADAASMKIVPLTEDHFPEVAQIYKEGLSTGVATFETEVPSWDKWNSKFLPQCRFVVVEDEKVIAWAALSAVSKREVYRGVAEDTIYVGTGNWGKGIGRSLLSHLVSESEKAGFWTLQAGIFPENERSIKLHENCGFRILGIREKVAQRDGTWYDNVLMERRSKNIF